MVAAVASPAKFCGVNQSLIDWVKVWVEPSVYVTVKVWLAWLPLTPVARKETDEALPVGSVSVWPAALMTSLTPTGPRA